MLKNGLRLFIMLLLSIFYLAFLTHKIMNHFKEIFLKNS